MEWIRHVSYEEFWSAENGAHGIPQEFDGACGIPGLSLEDFVSSATTDDNFFVPDDCGSDPKSLNERNSFSSESRRNRVLLWMSSDSFRSVGALTGQALVDAKFGQFFKFRKPEKLHEWLISLEQSTQDANILRLPHEAMHNEAVVVTSWKNAKSCKAAISDPRLVHAVSLLVIVCDDGVRSMSNASDWLAGLPLSDSTSTLLCLNIEVAVNCIRVWRTLHEGSSTSSRDT